MVFVLFGVVGCYVMGIYLDKTKNFLPAIRTITIAMAVLYALGLVLLPIGNFWITSAFAFFAGIFNVPILPACYSYAANKLVGHMPPSVVNGLMMSFAQLYTFCMSFLIAYLLSIEQRAGISGMCLTMCIAAVGTMFINEKKGRQGLMLGADDDEDNKSVEEKLHDTD